MLLPLSCLCSLQFAIHAHSLVIRVNLLLYLQTHQLMRCLLCLCSLLFASLSCLCSLLFAASYLRVSRAPSLVPLQSPVCSLLFASLSCSLSRAFAASYLWVSHAFAVSYVQPPICKSLLLPLSCLCSLLFASLPHSGRGAAIRDVAQNSSRRWAGEFLNDRVGGNGLGQWTENELVSSGGRQRCCTKVEITVDAGWSLHW